jgi:hypothetical protein
MLNYALAQDMFSTAQFDRMIKTLDDGLRIYTGALFVLSVVVLGLLICLAFYETRQPKSTEKLPSKHRSLKEQPLEGRQLLHTEP